MYTRSEMFDRVLNDLSDLQSDLSSAEACEDTSEKDQAIANKLWDIIEEAVVKVNDLQRTRKHKRDEVMYEAPVYLFDEVDSASPEELH
jgi:hypothetical protein